MRTPGEFLPAGLRRQGTFACSGNPGKALLQQTGGLQERNVIMEKTFRDLGLSEEILKALEQKGYGYPTTVQEEAIGPLLEWRDVIAKAPTGTGKTFAFGIPMIEHIDPDSGDVQGLILAPTRELALQIGDELRGLLAFYKNIRVAVLYGGAGIEGQLKSLKKNPQLVVATPGRLMDFYNRHAIHFDKIQTVILDEADRMLDMGFFKDVTRIIEKIKNRRNMGLFSATISQEVMTVSWMYQRDEVEITVRPTEENRPDIDQYSLSVSPLEKEEAVLKLLRTQGFERVMIFCNTKVMCQRLGDDLKRAGLDAECLHGDIRQVTREKTMQQFRSGALPVLIATDVASRGIDVDDVDCVLNYDVPEENEYYIHRIGRTGRARKKGIAFSIVGTFPEKAKLDEIAKYSHFTIRAVKLADDGTLTAQEAPKPAVRKRFR
jgi:ATP-dependent RNA helicase DeaD